MVADLRDMGLHVHPTHRLGSGFPDLIVSGYSLRAAAVVALLVEVKSKGGTLTDDEKKFHQQYPEDGPLIVAYSADDVLVWFGRV